MRRASFTIVDFLFMEGSSHQLVVWQFTFRRRRASGFITIEVLLAVLMFAVAGTAMVVALNNVGDLSFELHRSQRVSRILDSELRRAMSIQNIEEGKETKSLVEMGIDIETLIEPIEEMVNQDDETLSNMFRVRVSAHWRADGENQSESVETWRYGRLYRQ